MRISTLIVSIIAAASSLTLPAMADSSSENRDFLAQNKSQRAPAQAVSQPLCNQGHETTCNMQPGYNAPARINANAFDDVFVTADFILWRPEFAIGIGTLNHNGSFIQQPAGTLLFPNAIFDFSGRVLDKEYAPGFKVGAGFGSVYDNWVLSGEWTRFRYQESGSLSTVANFPTVISPAWLPGFQSGFSNSAHMKWHLKYDTLDLNLSRPYYLGTRLTFEPFFGARGAIINHRLNSFYVMITHFNVGAVPIVPDAFPLTSSHIKANSWFIGPRSGVKGSWLLSRGFRMIGDTAVALLFVKTNSTFRQVGNIATGNPNQLIVKLKGGGKGFVPVLDFNWGFGWGSYFKQEAYHFDISASYNFNCYFDEDPISAFITGNTQNLVLHGLDVRARFDY